MSDYLPVAVRVFTEAPPATRRDRQSDEPRVTPARKRRWRRPRLLLVFDTETTTDVGQSVLFGCARLHRLDKRGAYPVSETLFHADDLAERDPAGHQRLVRYAARRDVKLCSRREFVREWLWPVGYEAKAWIVGFNLPFDLSRLAVAWSAPLQAGSRGFSLALWDYQDKKTGEWRPSRYRPLITINTIDSKRALIRFGRVEDPKPEYLIPEDDPHAEPDPRYTYPGNFLDLRTLAFALTGEGHSLESACKAFQVKHRKGRAEQHGVINARYIDYCRRDVLATAELCFALLNEYERHPIGLRPTLARSPASIAKGYLDEMGVVPFLDQHVGFPRTLLGQAMVGYIGGRVETRLRRQVIPVTYLDFLSMYPTVNANMDLWRFFTCEQISINDATPAVRELVETVTLDDLFQRDAWRDLVVLCLVEPDGEVLPARALYESGGAWQIGINPLRSRLPLWMPLTDVIAAKLLGGRAPRILEALRLNPIGFQPQLRPIRLLGEVEVDPARDDFFKVIVEQRERLKSRGDLSKQEREWRRLLLKVIVNAASYGITAEINPTSLGSASAPITVYALGNPFTQRLHQLEQAGRYCFPPLAATITGAARLMLALLESCVSELEGSYVFSDTDSMAVVATGRGGLLACNGGQHELPDGSPAVHALSYSEIDDIVDRFANLSPYDPTLIQSILKIEDVNYNKDGERRPLHAYSISAKRYALLTPDHKAAS
jgi:hypothetical protein